MIRRHKVSQHFGGAGRFCPLQADIVLQRAGNAGQRRYRFGAGQLGINGGRLLPRCLTGFGYVRFDGRFDRVNAGKYTVGNFGRRYFAGQQPLVQIVNRCLV